jgi:predicted butyrate kinase (DUF1464 family)
MTRVVGFDPGTVSIDVCGLIDGRLYLDRSWPTEDALAHPGALLDFLRSSGVPELVAGPSGYGLPLVRSAQATDDDLRLAFLAPPEEPGGIGGLRRLARELGGSGLPVVYLPGVIHLDTVPDYRKVNRVDMGTSDKLCAAALGIHQECDRRACGPDEVSFILLELGGGFTAGVAVEQGQIVDGIGGTAGPIGWRSPGALDGEVAFLAGHISKASLFQGGVASLLERQPRREAVALRAYVEGAAKAVKQLCCSASSAAEILISGRKADEPEIVEALTRALADVGPVRPLRGFAKVAKQGAQGAALLADGLSGGPHAPLVKRLRLKEARGTVLDHLVFISPEAARRRLGIAAGG